MPEQPQASHGTAPQRRRALIAAGVVAAAIALPALGIGRIGDDFIHESYILDHLQSRQARGPWWNMFDARVAVSEQISFGGLPWWASPSLRVSLFRPLATLTHYVDYLLWPNQPLLMHLHNLVLYVLIVLVVTDLYGRLLAQQRLTAWLAAMLYAADDGHALGTAWIASRNTLLTALFALLCLSLYQRSRTTGGRLTAWLAPLALLLAHASSEGAIAIWAYLLGHAVLLDTAPPLARLRALAPLAFVSAAWLSVASLLGFGVSGSGAYLDPRTQPLEFIAALPDRLPPLVLSQFGITDELGARLPASLRHAIHALVCVGLAAGAYALARVGRRQPLAVFFAAGSIGALLPMCAVGPVGRVLFISGFGAHASIAMLLAALPWSSARRSLALVARSFAGLIAAASICIALYGMFAAPAWWTSMHTYFRDKALTLPRGEKLEDSVIMLVNTRDYVATPFVMLYRRLYAGPGPIFMHVLGVTTRPLKVSRPDDTSLVLTPEHGYLDDPTSILVRARSEPFALGQQVPLLAALVRIERLTADARPAQVRIITFGLENPKLLWVVWDDQREEFVKFVLPAVGQSVVLPAAPTTPRLK